MLTNKHLNTLRNSLLNNKFKQQKNIIANLIYSKNNNYNYTHNNILNTKI